MQKKLKRLTKHLINEYGFLLSRTFFCGTNGYQNYLGFSSILNSVTLNNNQKVTSWQPNGISSEKVEPPDESLTPKIYSYNLIIIVMVNELSSSYKEVISIYLSIYLSISLSLSLYIYIYILFMLCIVCQEILTLILQYKIVCLMHLNEQEM